MAKRYHVSRHIDAPVERVWALLTDASSYSAWNRAVVSIEGPITEGATISLVSIVSPKRTFKLKVTDGQTPMRWARQRVAHRSDRVRRVMSWPGGRYAADPGRDP